MQFNFLGSTLPWQSEIHLSKKTTENSIWSFYWIFLVMVNPFTFRYPLQSWHLTPCLLQVLNIVFKCWWKFKIIYPCIYLKWIQINIRWAYCLKGTVFFECVIFLETRNSTQYNLIVLQWFFKKSVNKSFVTVCGNLPQSSFALSARLRESCRLANQREE
jgi:hypothetical protein